MAFYDLINLKNGDQFETIFEDKDLRLDAKITWDNTPDRKKITDIEFIPMKVGGLLNFEILRIEPCKNYFMIHLYANRQAVDQKPYPASITKEIRGITLQNILETAFFVFNIHLVRPQPGFPSCVFNQGTPKTKDGSIIISQ